MLPWVLLYGVTALLFNHPNVLVGPDTEVVYFDIDDSEAKKLPSAEGLATQAIAGAAELLQSADSSQKIELATPLDAVFTRQLSGSVANKTSDSRVVVDLETGKGYLRKRTKKETTEKPASETPKLESKLDLQLVADPENDFRNGVAGLLESYDFDSEKVRIRSLPPVEFDAIVDGKLTRLKLVQRSSGRGNDTRSNANEGETKEPNFDATLSVVGQHPREMNARSFLLRLHMAHGYPSQANTKWFWAIAVDLMFASMVFWGLSGVIMWWQIKRTRKLGFILLALSAVAATWLAFGMHWHIVNG